MNQWGDNWNEATWAASVPGKWSVSMWDAGRWYSAHAYWSVNRWNGDKTWG